MKIKTNKTGNVRIT